MVAQDKNDTPSELRAELGDVPARTHGEVPQVIDGILRLYAIVPTLHELRVHLVHIRERAITIPDYVRMTEVCVASEQNHLFAHAQNAMLPRHIVRVTQSNACPSVRISRKHRRDAVTQAMNSVFLRSFISYHLG